MNAQVDISSTVLETERLILRPWEQGDLQDFYEYASVDGVGQMAGWPPHENIETSQMILDSFIKGKKTFAVVEKATGKVIGSLGLEDANRYGTDDYFADKYGRELGYVLAKPYWGKGLMPEAVKRVLRWAFEEQKWDFALCGHFLENSRSRRVVEKSGFRFYKEVGYETRQKEVKKSRLYLLEPGDI